MYLFELFELKIFVFLWSQDIVEILDSFGERAVAEARRAQVSMQMSHGRVRPRRPEAEHARHRILQLERDPVANLVLVDADSSRKHAPIIT